MRSRFQTGVEIDLLKGGFFENRSKAKSLSYRSKFLNGLQSLGGIEENYSKRLNTVVQLFNRQKIDFLQKRSKLIDVVMRNERSLFHKRLLNKEDVLETQQRNAQIKALMHMYQSFSQFSVIDIDSSFYTKDIDVFDINEELLFKYLKIDNLDSLNYFSAKESSLKSRWLNGISLSAFSRYNYYDMVSNLDRSFYSYGVNLGVPIPFGRINDLKINKLESLKQLEETVRQKMLWLEKHDINFKANFVRTKTEKADYATKYSILIDDSIGCIEPFIEKGGNAFLYVDSEVETTIHRLTHRIANLSTYQTIEP
jgi:hypothetical protein